MEVGEGGDLFHNENLNHTFCTCLVISVGFPTVSVTTYLTECAVGGMCCQHKMQNSDVGIECMTHVKNRSSN